MAEIVLPEKVPVARANGASIRCLVLLQHRDDAELPAVRKAQALGDERPRQLEPEDTRTPSRPEREARRPARRERAAEEDRSIVGANGHLDGLAVRRVVREEDPLRSLSSDPESEAPAGPPERAARPDLAVEEPDPIRMTERHRRIGRREDRARREDRVESDEAAESESQPRAGLAIRLSAGRDARAKQEEQEADLRRQPVRADDGDQQKGEDRRARSGRDRLTGARKGLPPERYDEHERQEEAHDSGLRQCLEVRAPRIVAQSEPVAVHPREVRQPPGETAESAADDRRLGEQLQSGAPQDRPRGSAVLERQRRSEELAEPLAHVSRRASNERGPEQNDECRDRGERDGCSETAPDRRESDDRGAAEDRHQKAAPRSGEREAERERQERRQRPSRTVAAEYLRDENRDREPAEDPERIGVGRAPGQPSRELPEWSRLRRSEAGRLKGRDEGRERRCDQGGSRRTRARALSGAPQQKEERRARGEDRKSEHGFPHGGGFRQTLAVHRAAGQAVHERPPGLRVCDGDRRSEDPDEDKRSQRGIETGGVRETLEVVEEAKRPSHRQTAEEEHRPCDRVAGTEEAGDEARDRKSETEVADRSGRTNDRGERQREGEQQNRQPIRGAAWKANGENDPAAGHREGEEEKP